MQQLKIMKSHVSCGLEEICNFGWSAAWLPIIKADLATLDFTTKGEGLQGQTNNFGCVAYIASLNQVQASMFEPALIEAGFERVASVLRNINTGNPIFFYIKEDKRKVVVQ